MNAILFAKNADGHERRVAEFLERPKVHVHVHSLLGIDHDLGTTHFDVLRLNLAQLLAVGVTELRLEFEFT